MSLLEFSELETENGAVSNILRERQTDEKILEKTLFVWRKLVAREILLEKENEDLIF